MTQLNILSGGAAKGLVDALAPTLAAKQGVTVGGTFGAVGAMRDLLRGGTPADLLILTKAMIAELEGTGEVVAGSAVDIGTVATAVATRRGDPLPLVGTPALLQAAILEAGELYFPDPEHATAGIHVAKVLAALGINEAMAARLRTFPNGATAMAALARATGAQPLGITQASEILATPGVTLVAALPSPHGLATVYTAAVARNAAHPDLARWFAAILAGPEAHANRTAAGFSPPGK